ncbi:MAG: hypothetical protein IPJ17_08570 [Holophagales bacterium]|nr:MAG: hypothetical protein IPJ17_08570 [Holophagales bacterium]
MEANLGGDLAKKKRFGAWALAALIPAAAGATSSSTVWTPMTLDIQPYGVAHWGVDNTFTVGRRTVDGGGSFPTDVGLTLGVLPCEKLRLELGVDLLEASDHPLLFNAKLGLPEGALFDGAPALQLGIVNVGTKRGVTDQNTTYLVVGKTIRGIGRLSAGPYRGNPRVLVDAQGEAENSGWMIAFDRGFHSVPGPDGEFNRFVFAADYASGNNALGGGSAGLYYFFTKDISLLAGPVWFNEEAINGKWKWTLQLDINHPWFGGK